VVEKGKSMMSREERSHMRHRAHTRSSLAGGKARGRRTSGGQNESSPRILPKPDAYQCTMDNTGRTGRLVTHDRNSDDKVTIAPFFD